MLIKINSTVHVAADQITGVEVQPPKDLGKWSLSVLHTNFNEKGAKVVTRSYHCGHSNRYVVESVRDQLVSEINRALKKKD